MAKRYTNCREVRPGLWRARLTYPKNPITGIRPPSKDFYGSTAAEADFKRKAATNDHPRDAKSHTLGYYLESVFIPEEEQRHERGDVGYNHAMQRKSRIKRFILNKPFLVKSVRLSELRIDDVEELFHNIDPSITARVYNELRKDIRLALRSVKRYLPERFDDYFDKIPEREYAKVERKAADPEEILKSLKDDTLPITPRAMVAALMVLNCRPSEVFALQPADVDFSEDRISISKAFEKCKGGFKLALPKSGEKGVRKVPMGLLFSRLLRDHLRSLGGIFEWVFPRPDGKPWNNDSFKYEWPSMRKALNLPDDLDFYTLKHIGNSYALEKGVTPEAQARKMGHTTPRMAQGVYRLIRDKELERATEVYGT